ncbi:SGNH/GDSL hydrolase family protein [Alsobacter sp. SYSU M60028]|uniref:SGNH/GDSL hydrolase family protein n=1 Tax=Alsobacter ponti TaxID=2962936 RepID=A0ABT1LHM9_9HYPH|nr:SGNH/GDSL hydrolase family protein [Alsobacter ponti]MCP8941012.1 SGNH/GDSL hydrolase family protein [Alsobacter ponti]
MLSISATRRNEIATGLAIVGLALSIFLAGEIATVVLGQASEPQADEGATPSQMMALFRQVGGIELAQPGAVSGGVRINSLGFRGPELPMPKPADVVRIAFAGDSRTFDWLAEDEARTWPARAARAIGEAMPRCRVDYVNASGPLYGTRELLALAPRVVATDPDVAIVMAGDVAHDSAGIAKRNGLAPDSPRADGLNRLWPVWNRVERFFGLIFLNTIGLLSDVHTDESDAAWVAGFEARLTELVTRLQSRAPLVVIVQSGVPPEEARRPTGFAALHLPWRSVKRLSELQASAMRRVAQRTGAMLVDADAAIPWNRAHFDNALHLREPGREKMVAFLGRELGPAAAARLSAARSCAAP